MSAGLTSLMLYSTPSSNTSGLALLSVLTPRMRIVPPSEPGLALFWLIHTPGVLYHRLRGVGDGLVGLFFHVDRGNRTGEVHALDRAVAHDHDIFEDGGLFELHQPDVRCREYLGLKADVVECQFFGQCGNRHFESAVDTRRRTLERTHVDDRGAHDRVAFQVGDLSLDFQRLAGFRGSLFFREKHLLVDDAVGIGRSCEHLSEHVEDRGAAFRHRDAQLRSIRLLL